MYTISARVAIFVWQSWKGLPLAASAAFAVWLFAAPPVPAAPADEPRQPAEGAFQFEDPAEPLIPIRARSSREEDHIRSLALFAAARVAEQKQDYATALKLYQRAFRFDPKPQAALREIVPLAFSLNRQEEGVRYALILAERDPTDAALLRRLAIYLTDQGDSKRALSFYSKAVELEEKSKEKPAANTVLMWMEMGRLYFVAKQFNESADYFTKVAAALDKPEDFELSPDVQKALVNKGELTYQLFGESFLEAGRADDAQRAFEKVNGFKADEALHLYNQARVDSLHKQPAQALAKLETYLEKHFAAQGTGPYELYAKVLGELGQEAQVTERLERHRAADQKNLPLSFFLAERYRKAGELDKAAELYAALIEERKSRPPLEAITALVDVYHQQKQVDKLIGLLGESIGKAGSLTPLGDTGNALVDDKEFAAALVAAAEKQLADDATQLNYGERMAAALIALGIEKYDVAQTLFDAAMAAEGAKPEAQIAWGLELFLADQFQRAADVFEQGLEKKTIAEDNPAIYFYLAGALEMNGATDKALERARKAAEIKPDSPRFASRAAWIQFHAKRYTDARKSYQALLERFGKDHDDPETREVLRDARLVLSNIAAIEGQMDEAEEWLEQVLDEFPEDIGALNDLGYLWADADKHLDLAHDMIRVAVESDPKNMAYRDSLGWVLYRLGKYPEAIAELKVAAAVPDPDGVILDHLAEAQMKSGDTAAAIESWRSALAAFEKEADAEQIEETREKLKLAESKATEQAIAVPADKSSAPAEPTPAAPTPEAAPEKQESKTETPAAEAPASPE